MSNKYQNDPEEHLKKMAAMRTYNKRQRDKINKSMRVSYQKHPEKKSRAVAAHNKIQKQKCPICKKYPFLDLVEMKRHIKNVHCGNKFTCQICDKVFGYKDSLNRHMIEHHGNVKKHKCEEYPAVYTRKEDLEHHHITGKHYLSFFCKYCQKSLTFRYAAKKD